MDNLNQIQESFKQKIESSITEIHFLKNSLGTLIGICNYGARITHFIVNGKTDIVLGFNSLQEYINADERYHGVTAGRFANRIAFGNFKLNDEVYNVEINNGVNSLHGGKSGFHDKVWQVVSQTENSISLNVKSHDGEGGFPGNISITITYTLTDTNDLIIDYEGVTDKDTVLNLTNHAYFNLNGEGCGDVTKHTFQINASRFAAINEHCIPTGELRDVENTPFNFKELKDIAKDLANQDEQLIIGKGYDHSFEIKRENNKSLEFVAQAIGDETGIRLEVYSTEPAVQFYTGNYLNGKDIGKSGKAYETRHGFCFETQHHPDSPNQANFPSTILSAGDTFKSKTIYKIA